MEDPRAFLSCEWFTPALRWVWWNRGPGDGALSALKRGGCGTGRWARRERVLGPSGFRPLLPLSASVSLPCGIDGS